MELLHMKIFDLLLEPDLDFLRFPKKKQKKAQLQVGVLWSW